MMKKGYDERATKRKRDLWSCVRQTMAACHVRLFDLHLSKVAAPEAVAWKEEVVSRLEEDSRGVATWRELQETSLLLSLFVTQPPDSAKAVERESSRMHGSLGMTLSPLTKTPSQLPECHQKELRHAQDEKDSSSNGSRRRQRLNPKTTYRVYESDRFIPARSMMDLEFCSYMVTQEDAPWPPITTTTSSTGTPNSRSHVTRTSELDKQVRYKQALTASLLHASRPDGKTPAKENALLQFWNGSESRAKRWRCVRPLRSPLYGNGVLYAHAPLASLSDGKARQRHIPSSPTRILDAPELRDDYYLNLVSWGANNVLAVALDQIVYLYHTDSGAIQEIEACTARGDYVTSVAWMADAGSCGSSKSSDKLAIGTCHAELQVWDAATATKVRTLRGHDERIGALAWNGDVLASGSRDAKILHHDLRHAHPQIATLSGHAQEICGLAWTPDGYTLASGGNDNTLCLWDSKKVRSASGVTAMPRHALREHTAAVKALAWCPWERNLLASGGGTADRSIKLWNASSGHVVQSVATGSQVCGLVWSRSERELLSSHGFSQHELCLWRYPSMTRVCELTGHTARVLHLALSPDGSSVVSAAADETLRFWNVFASPSKTDKGAMSAYASLNAHGLPSAVIR
ncbi:Cell division cycle protein 20, partial [Globisporangium splendens]